MSRRKPKAPKAPQPEEDRLGTMQRFFRDPVVAEALHVHHTPRQVDGFSLVPRWHAEDLMILADKMVDSTRAFPHVGASIVGKVAEECRRANDPYMGIAIKLEARRTPAGGVLIG